MPFKTSKNKQVPRYNSSRKLSIMEEEEKTANEEYEKITASAIEMSSFVNIVDMELTMPKDGILQDSLKSNDVYQDAKGVVKKMRFSDQYNNNTMEFENLMDSCTRINLNKSEEEQFYDAHDKSNVQEAKATAEDIKSAGNTVASLGLKKLQEQHILANCQSSSSAAESAKVHRKSITTMEINASSAETYSTHSAAVMTNHGQIASSFSSTSVQSGENYNRFLSAIAQAMQHTMRSLAGLKILPRSIEASKVIVEELTSSQESSGDASNRQARSGKRTRKVIERSSKEADPMAIAPDASSPLVKHRRSWYKRIKGRQPISRVRNSRVTTSRRDVSAERQVSSQVSLTVGDTVLPLPARDPMAIAPDASSPLVERRRSWYKRVKGRQSISRMRGASNIQAQSGK